MSLAGSPLVSATFILLFEKKAHPHSRDNYAFAGLKKEYEGEQVASCYYFEFLIGIKTQNIVSACVDMYFLDLALFNKLVLTHCLRIS
jgi:hypothetical protein